MNSAARVIEAVLLALAVSVCAHARQSSIETATAPPPEGRPPQGALHRMDSKLWEIKLSLELPDIHKNDAVGEALLVPVSILDTWWQVDPRSFRAKVLCDSVPVAPALTPLTVTQNRFGDSRVEIPLPHFIENRVYAEVTWIVESWSCHLDEDAAARIGWPTTWPQEVERWRQASPSIDPADPQIQALRSQVMQKLPAGTFPLHAAKEIVRTASRALLNADHREGHTSGVKTRGIPVWGVAQALSSNLGGEADVTCICVALLRAMGFPSRPVIGVIQNESKRKSSGPSERFSMWGEVFIPEIGWVPFDPDAIRGGISITHPLNRAWDGFGSDADFNERVPITHELDISKPKASDIGRTASYAALCRLKTKLEQPGQGPTDILIQTLIVSRGRGRGGL
ncbi:MAG: hypothetical protein EXS15_00010 [Phycisphaerales bacterium]|nr:hypothetical protein [Phycisphaerales bacterium]